MVNDMSKVNAMQAIREARYAARTSGRSPELRAAPTSVGVSVVSPVNAVPVPPPVADPGLGAAPSEPGSTGVDAELVEALCGHRSMNNRSCRRPAGHAEKNHRYN
jgi:hypothetical protein